MQVDLDQFPSDKVIEILSNAENIKFCSDNIIFKNDNAFTQDFNGLIKKEKVITWFLLNRDFHMQGCYDLSFQTYKR